MNITISIDSSPQKRRQITHTYMKTGDLLNRTDLAYASLSEAIMSYIPSLPFSDYLTIKPTSFPR